MPDLDSIQKRIDSLDDQQAPLVLHLVVEHDRLPIPAAEWDTASTHVREVIAASSLEAYLPPPGALYSAGDLARVALRYYADSSHSSLDTIDQAITYATGPAERFGMTTLALGALVLAVLQTEIELKRGAGGQWSFRLHKKAASDATLGKVITTFIGHFTSTGK